MDSQDTCSPPQSDNTATNEISSRVVMCEESGMSQESRPQEQQHMNICTTTLQQQEATMNETKDMSRPASGTLTDAHVEEPATKRMKMEDDNGDCCPTKPLADPPKASVHIEGTPCIQQGLLKGCKPATSSSSDVTAPQATITSVSEGSSAELSLDPKHASSRPGSSVQLNTTTSSSSTEGTTTANKEPLHPASCKPTAAETEEPLPIKSLTMMHLHKKYTAELDYMLREFRKLERQLLGPKGNGVEENAGSRERREKLHSFILHLENTLEQIQLGVRLEAEGKSTVMVGVTVGEAVGEIKPTEEQVKQRLAESGALTNLTKEKEEEENVQKLEEHILANLLPVKVRLKKQLAAQQGASRNPVGMPVARRGMLPSATAEKGTGTFAAAAEQKRKQAEAAAAGADETQFGKPLTGGASSLTQKLHGQTLGSTKRKYGHGVGSSEPTEPTAKAASPEGDAPPKRKILYAGMAPGSKQLKSGVSAATGVHTMVMETPSLYPQNVKASSKAQAKVPGASPSAASIQPSTKPAALPQHARTNVPKTNILNRPGQKIAARKALSKPAAPVATKKKQKRHEDPNLTEEERKKLRKLRKRKKRRKLAAKRERERQLHILRQQQAVQVSHAPPKAATGKKGKMAAKAQGKKKGPRSVEYICSLCSEVYSSTCDCNPWWALTHHDCPKCRKSQVPRVDITSPANAIEYHPALLAHAEEGGGGNSAANGPPAMHINPSHIASSATFPTNRRYAALPSDSDSDSDLSDISDGGLSDDSLDSDFDDLDNISTLSPPEQAENESFGHEYNGPKLADDETSRLLILMSHASTCPGRHKHAKHRDVCSSVKYMMLHVRDCPGTTASYDICPFPWCRKVKHSLYHLVSCAHPNDCSICSSQELSPNLTALVGLNEHRRMKQRERRAAAMAAAAAAAKAKPQPKAAPKKPAAGPKGAYRPPVVAKPGNATASRKGSACPVPAVHLKTVPTTPAPASAVAIAAAAAAAKVAATAAAIPPTKPAPKPTTQLKTTFSAVTVKPSTVSASVPSAENVAVPVEVATKPVATSAIAKMEPELSGKSAVAPPSVQPRIVTTESVAKENLSSVVTPESPAAVSTRAESGTSEPATNVKIEDESPDKTTAGSPPSIFSVLEGVAPAVKAEEMPAAIAKTVTEQPADASVKKGHRSDEEHDEVNRLDQCCVKSRAPALGTVKAGESESGAELLVHVATGEKSQTPQSRSPTSSCSDEVKKKGDAVESISSC